MKILQITDLHLGGEGEKPFDVDVRGNFLRILALARNLAPDYLLLTGDLCLSEADRSIYTWVKAQVDATGISYDVLSGNHDDPVVLAEAFDRRDQLREGELFFAKKLGEYTLICLDTTTGTASAIQLAWLTRQLAELPGEALIMMHHPPLLVGVPYMDRNYPLQNREAVQAVLFRHPHPVHVFSGHYHVERIIHQNNTTVYITPSCFFQINPDQESFAVDHRRAALREIILQDGALQSSVRYLDMGKAAENESYGKGIDA